MLRTLARRGASVLVAAAVLGGGVAFGGGVASAEAGGSPAELARTGGSVGIVNPDVPSSVDFADPDPAQLAAGSAIIPLVMGGSIGWGGLLTTCTLTCVVPDYPEILADWLRGDGPAGSASGLFG